jgi:hypothetical protein
MAQGDVSNIAAEYPCPGARVFFDRPEPVVGIDAAQKSLHFPGIPASKIPPRHASSAPSVTNPPPVRRQAEPKGVVADFLSNISESFTNSTRSWRRPDESIPRGAMRQAAQPIIAGTAKKVWLSVCKY